MIDAGLVPAGPGAGRHLEMAATMRVGLRVAAALHALYWTIAACSAAGVVGTAAAVRFADRVGRAAPA